MNGWQALQEELDAWGQAGRQADLWWRDDDAAEPTEALERLLALAGESGAALALAVIPAGCGPALAERLAASPASTRVLQHGFAHANHAGPGEKKMELGPHRPRTEVLEELARGLALIQETFEARGLPVLVPPWNRIDPGLIAELPALGLRGLSTHTARGAAMPVKGLWQTNTHADIMRWNEPRGFLGEEAVLALLRDHLRLRRTGEKAGLDPSEPTGLLTHHLAHDRAAWDFLSRLVSRLADHPACRFLDAAEAFSLDLRTPRGGRA